MDEIAEFAARYNLDAAELLAQVDTGHWPTVAGYLQDRGAALSREDLTWITEAVSAVKWSRMMQAAPPAPADPTPEPSPAPMPAAAPTLTLEQAAGLLAAAARDAQRTAPQAAPAPAVPSLAGWNGNHDAIVSVRPDQASYPARDPAADGKAAWGNVIAKMGGAK